MRIVPTPPPEPLPVLLMNTVRAGADGVYDTLITRADLVRWLDDTGHSGTAVTTADVDGFRTLRDALRTLGGVVTGRTVDRRTVTAAVRDLNSAAAGAPAPGVRLREGRLEAVAPPGRPADVVRTSVAAEAVPLLTAGDRRLQACGAPGCVLFFVRNHPRQEWCSTTCGNRVRAARHYRRVRAATR